MENDRCSAGGRPHIQLTSKPGAAGGQNGFQAILWVGVVSP